MIIRGKYETVKIFTENIDAATKAQLRTIADQGYM